ncbi:MAG TPA: hypothetical protein VGT24_05190 [Candidatus Acidoferrales bacterium]|nr:hypothetical protein [Candidatus Acidoferrales bacterium]
MHDLFLDCRFARPAGPWQSVHSICVKLLASSALLTLALLLVPSYATSKPIEKRLGDHYLMLVNSARAGQLDARKLAQFDRSPYDGLAVAFLDAYETTPIPSAKAMNAQIAGWKNATAKDIWPWIYVNHMIGANDAEENQFAKAPYFERFQGADLDGKAGARSDFLLNWRSALHAARDAGVPGIVCDLEFYNNYKASDVGALAAMTGKPLLDVVKILKQLGAQMADLAALEYSGATVWFLFTGLVRPDYRVIDGQPYYLSATYLVEGLLDEIQGRHLSLRVVSGGSVGLGYCHSSVEDLRVAIEKRRAAFAPWIQKYEGILELAGTMTLWSDRSAKKTWVAQGACASSSAATVEELEPYMELLFRSYRYNWIYGSTNGGYFAFDPAVAPRFNAAVARAKAALLGQ